MNQSLKQLIVPIALILLGGIGFVVSKIENSNQSNIPGGLKNVYNYYEDGEIQECHSNGKIYYMADHRYPDEPQSV